MCDPLTLGSLAIGAAGTAANSIGQARAARKQEDEYNKWADYQKTIRTNQAWTSETCAADNNWVKIGDENYFVNTADGRLMPSKKGQQPPDLFYFNLPQK